MTTTRAPASQQSLTAVLQRPQRPQATTRPNMANRGYDVVVDVDAEVRKRTAHTHSRPFLTIGRVTSDIPTSRRTSNSTPPVRLPQFITLAALLDILIFTSFRARLRK